MPTPGATSPSFEGPTLAEYLADDLLDALADPKVNPTSPVAPTLQVLLTRMWDDARLRDRPSFDRPLYAAVKAKGYRLGEVLDQQLAVISGDDPDAVRSGLVIDLPALGSCASQEYGDKSNRKLFRGFRPCRAVFLVIQKIVLHLTKNAVRLFDGQ